MRGHHVAAGRQGVDQRPDDRVRVVGVREEVQDGDQEQPDGPVEVEHLAGGRVSEDLLGFAQVRVDVGGASLRRAGEQRLGVGSTMGSLST